MQGIRSDRCQHIMKLIRTRTYPGPKCSKQTSYANKSTIPLLDNKSTIPLLDNKSTIPLLDNKSTIPLLGNKSTIPLLDENSIRKKMKK
jgi:hypothetical protein